MLYYIHKVNQVTNRGVFKMRKTNVNVYEFSELSIIVQQKVIERYRNELFDLLDDDLKDIMKMEFNSHTHKLDFKLAYSLNYCQGDGVSFTGNIEGKEELLEFASLVYDNKIPNNILRLIDWNIIYNVEFIRGSSNYVHKYTVAPAIIDNYNISNSYCHINKAITEFEKSINKWYSQVCDTMEKFGYDTKENLYGDDNIKSYIEENECEFFIDGRDFL